jgi:hypothetical protein
LNAENNVPAATIKAARRPVVIAGSLATRRGWRESLSSLKIPVLTTEAGKGSLDETRPWSAGAFTNTGGQYAPEKSILQKAVLVAECNLLSVGPPQGIEFYVLAVGRLVYLVPSATMTKTGGDLSPPRGSLFNFNPR